MESSQSRVDGEALGECASEGEGISVESGNIGLNDGDVSEGSCGGGSCLGDGRCNGEASKEEGDEGLDELHVDGWLVDWRVRRVESVEGALR